MPMTTKEIFEEEIAKFDDWKFPVEILEGFCPAEELENMGCGQYTKEQVEAMSSTLAGSTYWEETAPYVDKVSFWPEAAEYIWQHKLLLVLAAEQFGSPKTIAELITGIVRHEHEHMLQVLALRKAGFDLSKTVEIETQGTVDYGAGPLESFAFKAQRGEVINREEFLAAYKAAEDSYNNADR